MLPPAALDVADRLIAILMTLVHAVAPAAIARSIPTLPTHTAQILALRLITLITTLIRISNFGIRAPANPTSPARIHPTPTDQRNTAQSLPRRPGWLLAALPDIAPAIAADLRALLGDPALIALLGAAPKLHRTLRPLMRGLDLAAPQPPPSPRAPPPPSRLPHQLLPPNPAPPRPHGDTLPSQARASLSAKTHPSQCALSHDVFVTL